jgi:hypothetical protein
MESIYSFHTHLLSDNINFISKHRTWQELEYRLDVLRATKGAHIEVYWGQ